MTTNYRGPWPFNPFTVEGAAELARMGFKPARMRRVQKHARALEALERAEAAMRRAFKRWDKLRGIVARAERELDAEDHSTE